MKTLKLLFICFLLAVFLGCVSSPKFKPTVESSEEFQIEYIEDEDEATSNNQG